MIKSVEVKMTENDNFPTKFAVGENAYDYYIIDISEIIMEDGFLMVHGKRQFYVDADYSILINLRKVFSCSIEKL